MRIGVSISSTHVDNGPALMIERARTAHSSGVNALTIGDHHNMGVPYAQNTPMLGRMLAEWPDRPAGCLFLVPLWHPLLMAEHIGTLAATHNDTFIVQTGIGWGEDQFAAFGADHSTRGRALEQAIPVVKALLAGERIDAPEFGMSGARVGLRPRPDQEVDWWIAGGVDVAVRRAARMGNAWYATAGETIGGTQHSMNLYRSEGGERAIVRLDGLILEDGDAARTIAEAIVARGYRGQRLDQLLVGDPDDAAAKIAQYAAAGFDDIMFRAMSAPQELAIETLTHLGALNRSL